jgi:hypothetical protein
MLPDGFEVEGSAILDPETKKTKKLVELVYCVCSLEL